MVTYDAQERWIDNKEAYDKQEREAREQLLREQKLQEKEVDVDADGEWEQALKDWEEQRGLNYVK